MLNNARANLDPYWWLPAELRSPLLQGQTMSTPQMPQALPGGLLALLAAASGVLPLQANATPGTADTTTPAPAGVDQVEDRTPQRYVSGIADQMRGAAPNAESRQFAYKTNCDNGYSYCLGRLRDLRSRSKCDKLKATCEDGIPTIFGPKIWGVPGG